MKQSLQDTRANLSKLIDALAETGPVEITRHGKVVAKLVGPTYPGVVAEDDFPPELLNEMMAPFVKKAQTGSFEVSDTPPHPGVKAIPNTAQQQQAARDALLNAMKKGK